MRPIAGRTIIDRCLSRLLASRAAPVLLATTTRSEDDTLEAAAARAGVETVRGSEDDVLDRFLLAARTAGADWVVRATADNPAVDIDAPHRMLARLADTGADHVVERDLPYGAAVEAISVEALARAAARVTAAGDREHVTSYIRREHGSFMAIEAEAPEGLRRPDLRLTVDTIEDLRHMDEVLASCTEEPSLAEVIAAADRVRAGVGAR
jgi:spore coat polysaccharide biosynthesis protein SpsF